MTAPRCLWCGGAIAKRTETVAVNPLTGSGVHRCADVQADIRTIAEAKRHTNQAQVTAISKGAQGLAWSFNTWDGVSYIDPHFCKGTCADRFGRWAARQGVRRA